MTDIKKDEGPYADIIRLERPVSRHAPMPVRERARIFSPFAAVRSHEKAVALAQEHLTRKAELTAEQQQELDRTLRLLQRRLDQGESPSLQTVCFRERRQVTAAELEEGITGQNLPEHAGQYETLTASLRRIRQRPGEVPPSVMR